MIKNEAEFILDKFGKEMMLPPKQEIWEIRAQQFLHQDYQWKLKAAEKFRKVANLLERLGKWAKDNDKELPF